MSQQVSYREQEQFWSKVTFDLLYSIVMKVILLSALTGSIISKFFQLRELNESIDHNIKNVCFICDIEKQIFDRHSKKPFEKHIEEDHNPLSFIYYLNYLRSKDPTDYNGVESFVS
jgi:hypothetical protein